MLELKQQQQQQLGQSTRASFTRRASVSPSVDTTTHGSQTPNLISCWIIILKGSKNSLLNTKWVSNHSTQQGGRTAGVSSPQVRPLHPSVVRLSKLLCLRRVVAWSRCDEQRHHIVLLVNMEEPEEGVVEAGRRNANEGVSSASN